MLMHPQTMQIKMKTNTAEVLTVVVIHMWQFSNCIILYQKQPRECELGMERFEIAGIPNYFTTHKTR